MNIFLPIAQMSLSVPVLFAAGGVVGLLSGLFGVGGAAVGRGSSHKFLRKEAW